MFQGFVLLSQAKFNRHQFISFFRQVGPYRRDLYAQTSNCLPSKLKTYIEYNIVILQKLSINVEQVSSGVEQLREAKRRVGYGNV